MFAERARALNAVLFSILSLKQWQLIGVNRSDDPLVGAEIDAVEQGGKAGGKQLERLGPRRWEASTFPDLVKAARVASVAADQVTPPYAQPACDPDVDGVGLGEGTPLQGRGQGTGKRESHGGTIRHDA
jgi:hypothetical protein